MWRSNDEAGHLTAKDQECDDPLTPNSDPGHPHPRLYEFGYHKGGSSTQTNVRILV